MPKSWEKKTKKQQLYRAALCFKIFSMAFHHLQDTDWALLFGMPLVFEFNNLIPKIIKKERKKKHKRWNLITSLKNRFRAKQTFYPLWTFTYGVPPGMTIPRLCGNGPPPYPYGGVYLVNSFLLFKSYIKGISSKMPSLTFLPQSGWSTPTSLSDPAVIPHFANFHAPRTCLIVFSLPPLSDLRTGTMPFNHHVSMHLTCV